MKDNSQSSNKFFDLEKKTKGQSQVTHVHTENNMFTHILRSTARTTTRKCTPYCATKNSVWQRGYCRDSTPYWYYHQNQHIKTNTEKQIPNDNTNTKKQLTIFGVIGTVYFFCGGQDGKLDRMERKINTLESSINVLNTMIGSDVE